MVKATWIDGIGFSAETPSGHMLVVDSGEEEHGGKNRGPSPLECLLLAVAACSAMDVISILRKKRQAVRAYRVEVEGDRVPPGEWPRPYRSIRVRHFVSGDSIDQDAVARAVELSDTKYCSVIATLREQPDVRSEWLIEG